MHILPKYISTHFFNNCCQNVSITTKRIKELYSEFIKLILISLPTLCVWIKKQISYLRDQLIFAVAKA